MTMKLVDSANRVISVDPITLQTWLIVEPSGLSASQWILTMFWDGATIFQISPCIPNMSTNQKACVSAENTWMFSTFIFIFYSSGFLNLLQIADNIHAAIWPMVMADSVQGATQYLNNCVRKTDAEITRPATSLDIVRNYRNHIRFPGDRRKLIRSIWTQSKLIEFNSLIMRHFFGALWKWPRRTHRCVLLLFLTCS